MSSTAGPPTPPPTSTKAGCTTNRSNNEQQYYGPDSRIGDRCDDACAKVDAELGQHPGAYEGADYADKEVADQTESDPLHDLASQPSGDDADYQYDEKTFTRHVHLRTLMTICQHATEMTNRWQPGGSR
jgi:hypothetical protein